jgi:hypothetical protein
MSATIELISQQKLEQGEEIKSITVFASPSKITSLKPWDTVKEIVKILHSYPRLRGLD